MVVSCYLIETDHLPPDAADDEPRGDVEHGEDPAHGPPLGEAHVAGAEEGRRRANAVVGGAAHQVGEAREHL